MTLPSSHFRKAAVIATLALLAGCATRFNPPDPSTETLEKPLVSFQRAALSPKNGGNLVAPEALRKGDIILSAANGLTSAGIRLWTLSPVSHAAVYIGEGQIAEAVGEGVRVRTVDQVMAEEAVIVAFRNPKLDEAQSEKIRTFALGQEGAHYNHFGIVLQAPFSIERRVCELPVVPGAIRDFCIRGIALVQLGTVSNDRFFCSQFVLEAYRHAGLPITNADPRLVSPSDILHMREGDVPSVKINQPLAYIGHLKFQELSPTPEKAW